MKRLVIMCVAFAVVLAACGSGDGVSDQGTVPPVTPGGSTTTTTSTTTPGVDTTTTTSIDTTAAPTVTTEAPATRFVDVYFVQDGAYATAVATAVPDTPDVAGNAIRALIAGPTTAQEQAGLSSAVPTDTLLLGITIDDGLAMIDLSREFEAGGGSFGMIARLAQVVYTLTQFSSVDEVEFWLDGEPVTTFSGEGLVLGEPQDRGDYLSALPLTPTLGDTADRWEQDDLPDIGDFAESDLRLVVLVAEDDVLNVRIGPGVENEIIGMLAPRTVVAVTGSTMQVDSSRWVQVVTPAGAGWVNGHFLAPVIADDAFVEDADVIALLDELAATIVVRGDITDHVSSRGLYLSHNAAPVRFSLDDLDGILEDPTTYKWPSAALDSSDPDQLAQLPDRTFTEAIADRFVSTWDDDDREYAFDEPFEGGNGRPAAFAIPFELQGFHFVSIYDSGDDPQYGGLDWTIWHVSFDYEDGGPVVVGLTLDEWSP
jgi:hypothetical protein